MSYIFWELESEATVSNFSALSAPVAEARQDNLKLALQELSEESVPYLMMTTYAFKQGSKTKFLNPMKIVRLPSYSENRCIDDSQVSFELDDTEKQLMIKHAQLDLNLLRNFN